MLSSDDISDLRQVNAEVNKFKYVFDNARYGQEEYWDLIGEEGGDCEDYALEKRRRLMALGWDADDLRLTICQTEEGEYHCVLTVDDGDDTLALDNRFDRVRTVTTMHGYKWVARQKGKTWVRITKEESK